MATRQLLTFGRGQALLSERLDVNALVRESAQLLRRAATDDIEVRVDLAPGPLLCDVDQGQYQAALLNLVVNSRDAIRDAGTITVSTAQVVAVAPGRP